MCGAWHDAPARQEAMEDATYMVIKIAARVRKKRPQAKGTAEKAGKQRYKMSACHA